MKRTFFLLELLLAVIMAGGCSSSSSSPAASAVPGSDPQAGAAKATVTFQAEFPSKGSAAKSLIDSATQTILVNWCELSATGSGMFPTMPECVSEGTATLTPAQPSTTVTLQAANHMFAATAYDSNNNILETAGTSGVLASGSNTVNITFLNGKWTLKNGTTDAPIELSNGLVLDGFVLQSAGFYPFPYTGDGGYFSENVPVTATQSLMSWGTHSTGQSPWSGPQRDAIANHFTQFTGGATNLDSLATNDYNLTKECFDFMWWDCPSEVGDQIIGLMGNEPQMAYYGDETWLPAPSESTDLSSYSTTKVTDGTTITGNIVEYKVTSLTETLVSPAGGPAKAAAEIAGNGKKAAITAAAAAAIKSAQTTHATVALTGTDYSTVIVCRDGFNGGTADGVIELGTWNFAPMVCTGSIQGYMMTCDYDTTPGATTGRGNQVNGVYEYYLYGSPDCQKDANGMCIGSGNPGECNYGFAATDSNNLGEYCANGVTQTQTGESCSLTASPSHYTSPGDFYDMNGDGTINFGSFKFTYYQQTDFAATLYIYPFTAKGTELPGTTITVSKSK